MKMKLAVVGGATMLLFVCAAGKAQQQTPGVAGPVYEPLVPTPRKGERLPASLTPAPPAKPRLTGPKVFAARPGSPFLFTVTATGERPIRFSVHDLPPGLKLDPDTGEITGKLDRFGVWVATVTASNTHGTASRSLRIVGGDRIALTPPLGWNHFNCFGVSITAEDMKRAADAMVKTGLRDHGFCYINLDEGWSGPRKHSPPYDKEHPGPLTGDPRKFPDMKGLADYIHARGLKFGIYSTPRAMGYQNFPGGAVDTPTGPQLCSIQDVSQFVEWGVDYLKYDGDKPTDISTEVMAACLQAASRDIVYSLSNNAGCDQAGAALYARFCSCWRVGYDITDGWSAIRQDGFDGGWANRPQRSWWAPYSGPGHFIDPDMLAVGHVAFGNDRTTHLSNLTADEQYSHLTQWCMLASPLLFGGDMTKLDPFTRGLLTNDEVLAVDQDPLGVQAVRVSPEAEAAQYQVWSRPLEDGSRAVALYNMSSSPRAVTVKWSELDIIGSQRARDLWRQKDIGTCEDQLSARVGPHGVVLVRLWPATEGAPTIRRQPEDVQALLGKPITLSVEAAGPGPLSYRWTRNGSKVPGAKGASWTFEPSSADDGASIRCVVSNRRGNITSYEAILRVAGAEVFLSDLAWLKATTAVGQVQKDATIMGAPLRMGGRRYAKGLGTHASSEIVYPLRGHFSRFRSVVGLDAEGSDGSPINFQVFLDGKMAWESGTLQGERTKDIDLDVRGKREMRLVVRPVGKNNTSDHVDWANARLARSRVRWR